MPDMGTAFRNRSSQQLITCLPAPRARRRNDHNLRSCVCRDSEMMIMSAMPMLLCRPRTSAREEKTYSRRCGINRPFKICSFLCQSL